MICKFSLKEGAPEVQVYKFSGNPLKYQYFSTIFKAVVERKSKDKFARLTYQKKFTYGESKNLTKLSIDLIPDIGYDTAIMVPSKRYGNSHSLLATYRKEITSPALVRPRHVMGFRTFCNFDLKRETFSKSTNWNSLEMPETLCVSVSKLPGNWSKEKMEQKSTGNKERL